MSTPDDSNEQSTTPSLSENLAIAARRSGLGRVAPGEAPSSQALLAAMGGVRGIVESVLPGVGFVVIYAITGLVLPSVLIPLALAVVFIIARVIARQPWTSSVAGVLLLGVSAGLALITGRAEDNFLIGFFINGIFLIALVISIVVRWPLIGIVAALITGEGTQWRVDRAKFRVALIATILWCGLFATRLIVELPLYFAGNAGALATAKLILGVPFYAAMLWVTWLLVRTAWSRPSEDEDVAESETS
ncbi:hypothetical protein M2152_001214 [Microbacteriaceae bacterium SG_E_30_P1]|uniref:DUF3159 domain-containing protein n=1 Tax=Antiquaquibacter oligotrophicus TaxID=2880260 RepID=A0ABT6KPK6_9MICO|nr:DUF3159 domain-containing protein [Antiquaquibacter oligotrophicus]MDH6181032.1 hypothetical protein [Antiquaquibacter oligotrophicus]UDF13270.1 DUF3159 domain-containing protein [Antiquaquibacter oligotrophicus]